MGDIALRRFQVGIESVYGTAVPATRPWYGLGDIQQVGEPPTVSGSGRGSYDANFTKSQGVLNYDWSFSGGLDLDDMVEQLRLGIDGDMALPTSGAGPYLWEFVPGVNLASATIEWDASGKVWEGPGSVCNTLNLSGNANGGDVTVELAGFSQQRDAASMTALSVHQQNIVQGWELKLFVDEPGGAFGTTELPCTLIGWSVEINNNHQRARRGNNSRFICSTPRAARTFEGNLLAELNTDSLAEIVKQEAVTERLLRLELAGNVDAGGSPYLLQIDAQVLLSTHTIEDEAEMSTVNFDFMGGAWDSETPTYQYNLTNTRAA